MVRLAGAAGHPGGPGLNHRQRFILDNTQVAAPPGCPEIKLHLATEITPLWQATETFLAETNTPPPYWAFAWVGGQALSRYVLDTPELVRGKRVLDFAAGCGMTAIAAAMAGAAVSEAAEIDPMAVDALLFNADLNKVAVQAVCDDLVGQPNRWDVILAGDICYERPMAERVFVWLKDCARQGAAVLMADPGRSYLPKTGLLRLASYPIPCSLELEDREMREASVFRIVG